MIWNADTKEEALAFVQAGKGVRLADGVGAIDEVNTSASFYVGNNSVGKINYTNNGDGQTVCFTTNGGDLVVNGKSDTVNHYAYLDNLTVEHVNSASYHEYGSVRLKMTVNDGHVVMEENSSVNELVIPETEEGNSVSIDIKNEADVESLVVNDAEATVVVGAEATVNEVVGETSNISGEGAQAAKQNEVEKTFVYNVATEEHLTLPQAIEQKKEYIVLAENINLSAVVLIDYSAKIDGQGYAIKSSANRVFRLSASDIVVNLRSVDIESTYTGSDSRAISIDSSLENITLLLNESSLKAKYYALNITGVNGSGSKNVKCYISNTRIEGYAAINNHASLAYFEVNNSVLIGNNQFNAGSSNSFACIVFDGSNFESAESSSYGSKIVVNNTAIKTITKTTNYECVFSSQYGNISSEAHFNGITWEYEGDNAGYFHYAYSKTNNVKIFMDGELFYEGR